MKTDPAPLRRQGRSKFDAVRAAALTGDMPQNVNFAVALDVLADFLEMNQVPFGSRPRGASLDTAQVARMAQQFTYRVECEGAPASPAPPQQASRGLPPCLGDPATSFWTNCVGTYTHPSGQKYVGEFRDGKANGQGTLTFPSGAKYVGEFREEKYHGQGTYTHPDGQKYVGEFRDDKKHGQGTYTYPSGQKYVGEYRDDKRNGQGTYTFPDGAKYVGEFRDNDYHGQGTLWGPTGNIIHSGRWVNNKPAP